MSLFISNNLIGGFYEKMRPAEFWAMHAQSPPAEAFLSCSSVVASVGRSTRRDVSMSSLRIARIEFRIAARSTS